jgi:hypothetical protein
VAERYVRPPLVAREPAPAWVARWRFRVVALVALALLVLLCVLLFRQLTGATAQDPGVETLRPLSPAAAAPR